MTTMATALVKSGVLSESEIAERMAALEQMEQDELDAFVFDRIVDAVKGTDYDNRQDQKIIAALARKASFDVGAVAKQLVVEEAERLYATAVNRAFYTADREASAFWNRRAAEYRDTLVNFYGRPQDRASYIVAVRGMVE